MIRRLSTTPGTTVCFDVIAQVNRTVPSGPEPQVLPVFVDAFGDAWGELNLFQLRTAPTPQARGGISFDVFGF